MKHNLIVSCLQVLDFYFSEKYKISALFQLKEYSARNAVKQTCLVRENHSGGVPE